MRWTLFIFFICIGCSDNNAPPRPPVSVHVGDVVQKDVPVFIDSIGNVYSFTTVSIVPQVSGILEKTHVNQGQIVKKGDLLFTIDQRPYKAALDRAQAQLEKDVANYELSKATLERNAELVKKDYISKLAYDQLKYQADINAAQVKLDQADVETAQIQFDYTMIYAFNDGKVGRFNYDPGNLVGPTSLNPLTTINQIDEVSIWFTIPEKDFNTLIQYYKSNMRVDVFKRDGKEKVAEGFVYFIDNQIDTTTGTLLLKAKAANFNQTLWPGEFVKTRLNLTTKKQVLLVPDSALQIGQKGPYVYVLKPDMTVDYRLVVPKDRMDGFTVIEEGVKLGEKVITKGQLNLRPSSKVAISGEP